MVVNNNVKLATMVSIFILMFISLSAVVVYACHDLCEDGVCSDASDHLLEGDTCYYNCDTEICDYLDSCSVEAYCDGSIKYYDGTCSEQGCSFESEDCSELPTELTCSVVHIEDAGEILFENLSYYGCDLGDCVEEEFVIGYLCDNVMFEFDIEECDGDYYYCYYDGGYVWGDAFPESEADCSDGCFDGHDNDNDGMTDLDDEDCYECFADEDCNDSNSCTADVCEAGQCEYTNLEDSTECDDENPNTVNDACCSGFCYGETDEDGDGYGDDDCDDTNPEVNPGAEEVCCDEIDNNCDGDVDEGCECSVDDDCDDYNVCTIEECVDGCCIYTDVDDGTVCDDDNLNTVNDVCITGLCSGETDNDEDGYGDNDCDDSNPDVNPGATEVCDDGIDNDCDGLVDCDDDSCSADSACLPPTPTGGVFMGGSTGPSTYCSNEKCEYKEDCSNCPEDCLKEGQVCCGKVAFDGNCCTNDDCGEGYFCNPSKACEQISGGVVTEPECVEEWVCVDWSDCVNATQTRTCVDINDCGTIEEIPEVIQECVEESPITGLFTFVNSPTGYASMFILGLFLLMLFLSMRKK